MEYLIYVNGKKYDLPQYNMKIADKEEVIQLLNGGNQKFREKCKAMYDFCSELLGKDEIVEIIGKFEDIDPNVLNITYLEIVKAYNKPYDEYQSEELKNKLDDTGLNDIGKLLDGLSKVEKMKK